MIIEKTKTHLILKLEDEKDLSDIVNSDEFFMGDLQFHHSQQDGWQFIYDANRNQIVYITDYGYDEIINLLEKGKVELEYKENDLESYADYEWNKV